MLFTLYRFTVAVEKLASTLKAILHSLTHGYVFPFCSCHPQINSFINETIALLLNENELEINEFSRTEYKKKSKVHTNLCSDFHDTSTKDDPKLAT